jgi:class 3 adenylate cyclase/tetratricopeptide (TPR) repeat protein
MTTARPTTATILFSDLVNSTELLQRVGDETAQRVFETHHRMLRDAVAAHGGAEVKWTGDGLMVAFDSATAAVGCAIAMQQAARRPAAGEPLKIRVGLQVGEALRHDATDYFGTTVVIARRLCDSGGAGDILCSALVRALIPDSSAFNFRDRGALVLKGIAAPVDACEVLYEHDPLAMLTVTPFVGRDDVIASLAEKVEQARTGHGSLVLLVGEPGIGKTRTAEEFAALARHKGATVLWGRCYDGEWAPPFSPFVEAIKEYAAATPRDELAAALGFDAGILARIVPALRELLPDIAEPPAVPPEDERYRLLEAASNLFAKVASTGPVVLMLDDLHWADKGTIAMLRQVARQTSSQALVIVGGYRDVELDRTHPLADALATLRRETNYDRIVLKGLSVTDVSELLRLVAEHDVPEAFVRAISDETGGNPFFIREVMLHLIDEKKIVQEDGRWVGVVGIADMRIPEGVREVIGRRLSRVGDTCGRMLTVVSALTAGFSWKVIAALVDADDAALLDAIDEALAAQLIVERERGKYDFAHALIRHTLYEELSTPRRVLLHRRIGDALERLYGADVDTHLAELAHHFYQAAPGGDVEKAIDYATRAGVRAIELCAWEEAVGHFERALQAMELIAAALHGESSTDKRRRVDLLMRLGGAHGSNTGAASARDIYERAALVAKAAGLAEQQALAAARYAAWFDPFNDLARPVAMLGEALAGLPEGDSSARALVMASLAVAQYYSAPREHVAEIARAAVGVARSINDPETLSLVLASAHRVLTGPESVEERIGIVDELLALALNNTSAYKGFAANNALARRRIDLAEIGDIKGSQRDIEANLAFAREVRLEGLMYSASASLVMRPALEGRFDEAERLMQEALVLGQQLQSDSPVITFGVQLIGLRVLQGRLGEIEPLVRAQVKQLPNIVGFRCTLAFVHAELDNAEEARREFEELAPQGFGALPRDGDWLIGIYLLTEVCDYLGDAARAMTLYDLLLPYAGRNIITGFPAFCTGSASRQLGMMAAVMERWEDAERHFEDALAFDQKMNARPWVAHDQYRYAKMLLARGGADDRAKAIGLLQQALKTAEELGMGKVRADCERLLASGGVRLAVENGDDRPSQ